jgi:hypothetical protein
MLTLYFFIEVRRFTARVKFSLICKHSGIVKPATDSHRRYEHRSSKAAARSSAGIKKGIEGHTCITRAIEDPNTGRDLLGVASLLLLAFAAVNSIH